MDGIVPTSLDVNHVIYTNLSVPLRINKSGNIYDGYRNEIRSINELTETNNINWGLTILANGIKVLSTIFTILAADRNDR